MRNLYFFLLVIILFSAVNAQNQQLFSDKKARAPQLLKNDGSISLDLIELNNLAVEKGLEGKYMEAAADFRQIIAKDAGIYQTQYNLGRCLVALGQNDEAIEVLNNVIKIKPDHVDAQASIGEAYYQKRMFAESLVYFRRAVELDPNDVVSGNNLGVVLYQLKNFKESLKYLNIAIELQPNYAGAYCNRGTTMYAMGKKKEAAADFRKATVIDPKFAESFNNLGVVLGEIGKKEESHQAFLEAVRLRPNWSDAMYNLALSYIQRGERDLAREQLDTLSHYDSGLAEKGRQYLWQKYVVNANSFKEN